MLEKVKACLKKVFCGGGCFRFLGKWMDVWERVTRRRPVVYAYVKFDNDAVHIFENDVEKCTLPWENIRRIGYATTSGGPWFPDYFFVLGDKSSPPLSYWLDMDWPGVLKLTKFVEQIKDVKYTKEKGALANCTQDNSVVIWPPDEAGQSMG